MTDKQFVILVVGAMPSKSLEVQDNLTKNFTEDEWKKIRTFYVQGGLSYEKMNWFDKMILSRLRKTSNTTNPNSEKYRTLSESFNCVERTSLLPIEIIV